MQIKLLIASSAALTLCLSVHSQNLVTNDDFEGSFTDNFTSGSGSINYSNLDTWTIASFGDRSPIVGTAGSKYVSGATDGSTGNVATIVYLADVSGLSLTATDQFKLSFDVLNNDSTNALNYNYQLFYAGDAPDGGLGSHTGFPLPFNNSPYSFYDSGEGVFSMIGGYQTANAAANSGWTTVSTDTSLLGDLTYPGTFDYGPGDVNSTTIAGPSDITKLVIMIQMDNSIASTGSISPAGIDNVSLTVIPEPGSLGLFIGVFALCLPTLRRRR